MSADDIRGAFPQVRLELMKRAKLAEHLRDRQWAKAAALKAELDGPLPRSQVIPLRRKPQR